MCDINTIYRIWKFNLLVLKLIRFLLNYMLCIIVSNVTLFV
ncbi:hypothetical protein [Listeria phage 184]